MVSEFDRKGPAHAAFEALERASGHRISNYGCCVYADDDQDSRWRSFERAWPEIQTAALSAVTAERDGLAAARMAYANEFAPDEHGDPDVGSVHANICALKAERDRLRSKWARVESERDRLLAEVEALRAMAQRANTLLRQIADSGYDDDSIDALTCWLEEHPGAKLFDRVSAMAAKEA